MLLANTQGPRVQQQQGKQVNHTAKRSIEILDAIIYEIEQAYLKTDGGNKNQRQAAAISMMYAYAHVWPIEGHLL